MIKQIIIQGTEYNNFVLSELTTNNILLFPSPSLKDKVVAEVEKIWLSPEDNDNSILYTTSNPAVKEPICLDGTGFNIRYLETTIMTLTSGQKFICTTEPAFIYAARNWYDIWFVSEINEKIVCRALCEIRGSKEDWNHGLNVVYEKYLQGCYGCYEAYKNPRKGEYTLCKD